MAEQERKKIRQRQAEGITATKIQGKHLGRPAVTLDGLRKEQTRILEDNFAIWKREKNYWGSVHNFVMLGFKKNTFYKIIKEYEQTQILLDA